MPPVKLLIIDDEEDYASALVERLNLRKFDAAAVYSSKDAPAAIESHRPDVILLDLFMPGMDAKDMIMTLKDAVPDVEIIIVSGHADPAQDVIKSAFDYIIKPIEIKDLIEKVNKALAKKKGAA
ncbi:MAG: response regulator [Nitrospirae bacterium]|uniref:response regulator n=1 Tax=Candidatus Magnetominusculus dajiuhuensis TaxID=3137712 RepID=UPI0019FB3110|nr:response regulator [Nitrospirota bacterium]